LTQSLLTVQVNLGLEQWWVTPDPRHADQDTVGTFIQQCRTILSEGGIARGLLRACELHEHANERAVVLRFDHVDAGSEVSAVYHTADQDRMPPDVTPVVWPHKDGGRRSRPLIDEEAFPLTYPLLFPDARSGYDSHATTASGKRLTLTMWATYLLYHMPWHFQRCSRLTQELSLHVWNRIETQRLMYYYNSSACEQQQALDDDVHTSHRRSSFIPYQF
jgi:hypothetical protein